MIAINDYWLYNINKRNDLFFFSKLEPNTLQFKLDNSNNRWRFMQNVCSQKDRTS